MALLFSDRIIDSIEAYFAISPQMLALSVEVPRVGVDQRSSRLSLTAARESVTDPASPSPARDAIWSQIVRLAREKKEPWDVVAIWMMAPGLRRICRRCRRYGIPMGPGELQAEAVAGLVEAIHVADPHRKELGSWLWWTTYRHVQKAGSDLRHEIPTADIELVGIRQTSGCDPSRSTTPTLHLVNSAIPIDSQPNAVCRLALEGERLGSVAHRLGLGRVLDEISAEPGEKAA